MLSWTTPHIQYDTELKGLDVKARFFSIIKLFITCINLLIIYKLNIKRAVTKFPLALGTKGTLLFLLVIINILFMYKNTILYPFHDLSLSIIIINNLLYSIKNVINTLLLFFISFKFYCNSYISHCCIFFRFNFPIILFYKYYIIIIMCIMEEIF